jgi:NADH-quinone oxidoreductase subunit M
MLVVALIAVPASAAVGVALLGSARARAIRAVSLAAVLVDLAIAAVLAGALMYLRSLPSQGPPLPVSGPPMGITFQPEIVPGADPTHPHRTSWHLLHFGDMGSVQFFLGLDGLNVWLVVLTTVLMISAVLISWTAIQDRVAEYYAWLLALGAGMLGVFLAFDIILFYVFFELTLVPLFFLIGIWGGPERRHAARKFFIYTFAGSVITFLGLLAVVLFCYSRPDLREGHPDIDRLTFSIPDLVQMINERLGIMNQNPEAFAEEISVWKTFQFWVFLAMMAGFAIKVPLVPLHTWLPLAHVEAPTAGSVLLAGVLLKIGAYGFLRLCLPLAPDACLSFGVSLVGGLAVIGIIYGALCALAQDDIKKLVAYSSVSHLGFCMLGMFALNSTGLAGSLLQMINHGLSTGALFLLVGMLYERYHTRKLGDYSGMGTRLGLLSCAMIFICLSSIGLPGLNGFVGEALVFFGMFRVRTGLAVLGLAGIVLGAWYLLSMVRGVFFGPLREPEHAGAEHVTDLKPREWAALGPIMALCLFLGVYPQPVLNTSRADLDVIARIVQARRSGPALMPTQAEAAKELRSTRPSQRAARHSP